MTGALSKRERTRSLIRDAALTSFRERGYEATTIRQLAADLGISVGAAYYHFDSKSQLVQELYAEVQEQHRVAAVRAMAGKKKLADRLQAVFSTGLDQLEPFAAHGVDFLTAAINPASDASPFSEASAPSRAILGETFAEAIAGASEKLPADLVAVLPEALTRAHLVLSLGWVSDVSPERARTRALLKQATGMIGLALPALKIPPVRKGAVALLSNVADLGTR